MIKENRDGRGRAILMCAGEYEPMEILRNAEDLVIAVDGGLPRLLEAGIEPDLLLGDFDSLEEKYRPYLDSQNQAFPDKVLRLPCEKDDTDTVYAARVCLERGFRDIFIYGALGGRLDHTIANVQTLAWIFGQGGRGSLIGKKTFATVLRGEKIILPESYEGTFSLFALDERVSGVTLEGMKYPLSEAELTNTFPLGVSNEVTAGRRAAVTVREGLALMILQGEKAGKFCVSEELRRQKADRTV